MLDGRQSHRAAMIQRGVIRHFQQNGIALLSELILANGMRADLVGIDAKGRIILIEIKSSVEDFRVDNKWPQYLDFCDRFYFASHKDVPSDIFPDDEGFILADNYGAEIIRHADRSKDIWPKPQSPDAAICQGIGVAAGAGFALRRR